MKNLWVTNGEIDMQYRHMTIGDLALYKSAEAKGDYKTLLGISASHVAMQLNLSTKNKLLNEFFNNLKVRQAISSAVNRDQINQLVYNGLLTPRQYSPLALSPQYDEKAANAWIKYDPDAANKLLDEAGYSKKGADGIRLHKDGTTPISWIIEGTDQTGTPTEDAVLLLAKDLVKVGLKATYKYVERALYTQRYEANELDSAWWGGDRTVLPLVPEAIIFRGVQPDRPWCPGWGFYYIDPKGPNAVKPPDGHWIYDIWKIWDEEVAVQPDPAKQTAAFKKITDIWADATADDRRPGRTARADHRQERLQGPESQDAAGRHHRRRAALPGRDVLLGRSCQAHQLGGGVTCQALSLRERLARLRFRLY